MSKKVGPTWEHQAGGRYHQPETMRLFMFPGQSSCSETMLQRALALGPSGMDVLRLASDVLGEDLVSRLGSEHGVRPENNRDVQLSVFLANHVHMVALQSAGVDATLSLGLSLGEYNHLVHIGAIAFADALRLVATRGEAYDRGPRGMMVAVVGVDVGVIETVLRSVGGDAAISNFNGPTQHVIAGSYGSVEAAVAMLEEEHYAMSFVIERHVPMHSPRFEPAVDAFMPALRTAPWTPLTTRYFPNVEGRPRPESTAFDIVALLRAHVFRPVQWERSMDWICTHCPLATLIEVGPGRVLSDLARRGWSELTCVRTDQGDDPRAHLEALAGRLRDAA